MRTPTGDRQRSRPRLRAGVGVVVFLLLAAALWRASTGQSREPAPAACATPNILLITLDAIRTERMSCYGYFRATTPNLDRFAEHATRFTNATTPMPFTAPAHASVLTGLYPTTHGVTGNGISLPDTVPMLPVLLKEYGYATASIVAVWFLSEFGLDRGFDRVDRDFGEFTVRRADDVTRRSCEWLRTRRSKQPFFLWVHYYDPHEPYNPPPGFQPLLPEAEPADEVERRRLARVLRDELRAVQPAYSNEEDHACLLGQYAYDGEIQFADEQIGALLDYLRASGLYDSTLVVLVGDHGEAFGEHPGDIQHGFRLYQTTQRVPLLIRLPGQTEARDVPCVVSLVDLLPTFMDALDAPVPDDGQGLSLLPLLLDDPPPLCHPPDRTVFMERRTNRPSPSGPPSDLAPPQRCFDSEMYAVRDARWKLIWEQDATVWLYDLDADPDEYQNVADHHPNRVARMRACMMEQNARNREQAAATTGMTRDPAALEMLRSLGYVGSAP